MFGAWACDEFHSVPSLHARVDPGAKLAAMAGSAYYIAPEVLASNYGMEADMWSVGVVLYIMLCGVPPFWAEKEEDIFVAIKGAKVDVFSGAWEAISPDAKDLVMKLLTRDPAKRITPEKALRELSSYARIETCHVASFRCIPVVPVRVISMLGLLVPFKALCSLHSSSTQSHLSSHHPAVPVPLRAPLVQAAAA